ncbi:restart primosome assembly protein PriB [Nitrosospira sp. Nsp2]|uniref:primosomal replication protein N n=1 Tax=Nitrosospira sp. Nsp2 TaxID=136548 RepID=UPI000D30C964|nr:primosomal replication protein N [Nitrosospira sp. Nsp2]PTR17172.1 restart primosome assembly protein PriB [Nitrosospira sp. Nsp2]
MHCNQTVICGRVIETGSLRYTPAGIAVTEFKIGHASRQIEAGKPRKVECEIPVVALAQSLETVAAITPGTMVKVAGFLAKKNRMSLQLVLHASKIDFI